MEKMKTTTLIKWERKFRPFISRLPSNVIVHLYSRGRLKFLESLKEELPSETFVPPKNLSRELWGIRFSSPIMNAAGMFKNGECSIMVERQGAGAYLGGTGTWNPRKGNERLDIHLPFVTYPESHAASNFLGLPNDGDEKNYMLAKFIKDTLSIPVGWSVISSPDFQREVRLEYLVKGMKLYERAGVDFLEINESCPNTEKGNFQQHYLADRLKYVKENFLNQRQRRIPVIVKFSNDTETGQIPMLLDLLFENGFDGVNFGNTSTEYAQRRKIINPREIRLFNYFSIVFGGGVSGRLLKDLSLNLGIYAVNYLEAGPPSQEFHVIRTGGIETWEDIQDSEQAGISLNQWYTGYFENFVEHGHDIYKKLFSD